VIATKQGRLVQLGTGDEGGGRPARRGLQRGCFQSRYVPVGTRHPLGGLEAATPGGTCPLLGDFAVVAFGCWFCMRDLQGF